MSNGNADPTVPDVSVAFFVPLRNWTADLQNFRQDHVAWLAAGETTAPRYCLPVPSIERLEQGGARNYSLLDTEHARAERAFSELCSAHHAVGCWHGSPIKYDLMKSSEGLPEALLKQLGWTKQQQLQAQQLVRGTSEQRQRLKGYAGWLLTEPTFVQEKQELADCWQAMPPDERPPFPLTRPLVLPRGSLTRERSSPVPEPFELRVQVFLDRWGLTQLATWDLLVPQGPLLPNLLPPGSPALPVHGIHLVLPLHYPLQGADELQRQIVEFQHQAVRDLELPTSLAGLPHHKSYASLFDVIHLERAIRSRLPPGRPRPGFVIYLEEALAVGVEVSLVMVQKCRKDIAACLSGKRSSLPRLRPRNR